MIQDPMTLIRQAAAVRVQLRPDADRILARPMERLPADLAAQIAVSRFAVISALNTLPGQVVAMLAPQPAIVQEELQAMFDARVAIQIDNGADQYMAECVAFIELGTELERRYLKARQAVAALPEPYCIPMDDRAKGAA